MGGLAPGERAAHPLPQVGLGGHAARNRIELDDVDAGEISLLAAVELGAEGARHAGDAGRRRDRAPAEAEALLLASLQRTYLPAVLRLCPAVDDPRRLAALLDWTYNLGAGNLKASTLRRKVNAGHWAAVPPELRKWVKGGGQVLGGLVARRKTEALLVQSAMEIRIAK